MPRLKKLCKVLQDNSEGMTLIEVIIALAILGLVAVTFLVGVSTALKATSLADELATAQSLTQSQMESVKSQEYETAPSGGVATYDKISLSSYPDYYIKSTDRDSNIVDEMTGIPWDSENNQASSEDGGIQKITAIIYHDTKMVLTLEDYKVDR